MRASVAVLLHLAAVSAMPFVSPVARIPACRVWNNRAACDAGVGMMKVRRKADGHVIGGWAAGEPPNEQKFAHFVLLDGLQTWLL